MAVKKMYGYTWVYSCFNLSRKCCNLNSYHSIPLTMMKWCNFSYHKTSCKSSIVRTNVRMRTKNKKERWFFIFSKNRTKNKNISWDVWRTKNRLTEIKKFENENQQMKIFKNESGVIFVILRSYNCKSFHEYVRFTLLKIMWFSSIFHVCAM